MSCFLTDMPFDMLSQCGQVKDGQIQSVMLKTFSLETILDESVIITPNPR